MSPTQQQIIGHFRPAVAKDLLRRGFKVQAKARVLLAGGAGRPRRIDTGILRSSIQVKLMEATGKPRVRIGTNRRYAMWVHDGTGIYGPKRMPITPKRGKVLAFKSVKYGKSKTIFAKSVKGMRRNQFLKDALPAAKD